MLNKLVYKNLINLRNASQSYKIYTDLNYNKVFLFIINFLYKKGYILGYVFGARYKIRVYLKYYNDKGLLSGLYVFPRKPNFSYKSLKYLVYRRYYENQLYLFSTPKGWLTLDEIISYNISTGGVLYFCILNK